MAVPQTARVRKSKTAPKSKSKATPRTASGSKKRNGNIRNFVQKTESPKSGAVIKGEQSLSVKNENEEDDSGTGSSSEKSKVKQTSPPTPAPPKEDQIGRMPDERGLPIGPEFKHEKHEGPTVKRRKLKSDSREETTASPPTNRDHRESRRKPPSPFRRSPSTEDGRTYEEMIQEEMFADWESEHWTDPQPYLYYLAPD